MNTYVTSVHEQHCIYLRFFKLLTSCTALSCTFAPSKVDLVDETGFIIGWQVNKPFVCYHTKFPSCNAGGQAMLTLN